MSKVAKVACVGECMVELSERPDGSLARAFGGDTLNMALYLARLGVSVEYVTALGDDSWSDEMVAAWSHEGVGTNFVQRLQGRVSGLYVISTDADGERRFRYWRDTAPARDIFDPPYSRIANAGLEGRNLVVYSGISLWLYREAGRAVLFETLDRLRAGGCRVAFDINFRARLWPDRTAARVVFEKACAAADIIFASSEDLESIFGEEGLGGILKSSRCNEIVVRYADVTARVLHNGVEVLVPASPVADIVDTTAAGDSFAAAYLAARLRGVSPAESARAGHRLAGVVIANRGAIIPRDRMPAMLVDSAPC